MDHIPMMQDRVEEGLGDREHYAQQARLVQLTRFIVWGYLFVVTVLLALLVVFIFGNGNGHGLSLGCQQCQHTPAAADPLPAQQQKQVQRHQNPSALLTASESTTDNHRLAWEDKNGHAHLYGDFSYCNGYLIVPRNGLYRVYLQITYAHLGNDEIDDCNDGDTVTLNHVVNHENVGYGKTLTLLSAVHTVNCSVTFWRKTMYSAAMFDLKENDKLWVSSTQPGLIVVNPHQVFFGVDFQSD